MARALLAIVSVGLTVFALADCIQTHESRLRGLPRWAWIVLIVLIPWVGPLTWMLIGKERGEDGGTATRRSPRRQGPLAPDDDPEFLRRLDEDIRRERRDRRREQGDDDGGDGTAGRAGTG
ncbi:PLD nuclease N-terminal domain-containing protein [Brachybacterium squillarum]|uniref:PLD nuclease N-terminal domain-containing protein n=1 Tax=Brachybacterium squillarum TaxID=661979 RepID=UPI000262AE9E|nr:PLD nuclease N-terminal domain-containing protein [Brachybacterium squillarum]